MQKHCVELFECAAADSGVV